MLPEQIEEILLDQSKVDLSVGEDFKRRLGVILANNPVNEAGARKWMHNQNREKWFRFFAHATVLATPVTKALELAVLIHDGQPTLFHQDLSFYGLGSDVSHVQIDKIRSLRNGVSKEEEQENIPPPVFRASRSFDTTTDIRAHSWLANAMRGLSLDELPQLKLLRSEMALFGLRGYLLREREWLDVMFTSKKIRQKMGGDFPSDYPEIIDRQRPPHGILGLRTAVGIKRGSLTATERLITDQEFARRASPRLYLTVFTHSVHYVSENWNTYYNYMLRVYHTFNQLQINVPETF